MSSEFARWPSAGRCMFPCRAEHIFPFGADICSLHTPGGQIIGHLLGSVLPGPGLHRLCQHSNRTGLIVRRACPLRRASVLVDRESVWVQRDHVPSGVRAPVTGLLIYASLRSSEHIFPSGADTCSLHTPGARAPAWLGIVRSGLSPTSSAFSPRPLNCGAALLLKVLGVKKVHRSPRRPAHRRCRR